MPAVNGVGKPCAGEPHARIDGRELETEPRSGNGHGEERPHGKPCGPNGSVTYRLINVTAPVPDPPSDVVGLLFPAAGADGGDPQARGGVRVLGVPSVADRIAQTAAAMVLEPEVEKIFHPDSYGYRPGKSALDAVGMCRERCWQTDWVIDLDIKGFFDNLDHDLSQGGCPSHRPEVDPAVCAAVADSTAAEAGWQSGRPRSREPTGFVDLTVARQPVHALCVRRVDGPGVPGRPVRAVLR